MLALFIIIVIINIIIIIIFIIIRNPFSASVVKCRIVRTAFSSKCMIMGLGIVMAVTIAMLMSVLK